MDVQAPLRLFLRLLSFIAMLLASSHCVPPSSGQKPAENLTPSASLPKPPALPASSKQKGVSKPSCPHKKEQESLLPTAGASGSEQKPNPKESGQDLSSEEAGPDALTSTPTPELKEASPAPSPNPSPLISDEDILKEAETLAERGDYLKASQLLRSLSEASPWRGEGQKRLTITSNLAVQELRHKAARAFQNAKPLADRQARQAYLEEAKAYLEQALELYPEAELQATVKENLKVIENSLQSIEMPVSPASD